MIKITFADCVVVILMTDSNPSTGASYYYDE